MKDRETKYLSDDSQESVDLFGLTDLLIRQRKLIIIATVAVMAITAVLFFLKPNQYESRASILPTGRTDKMADLRKLAGIGGALNYDENSTELFPIIMESRLIQDAILEKEFTFNHEGKDTTIGLKKYLGGNNPDLLTGRLSAITTIETDSKTGLIMLSAETIFPGLSQKIVESYLTELESYNLHKRKSHARDYEQYLAVQLANVKTDMETLEDSLEAYQAVNRDWYVTSNPEILKTISRLKRDVTVESTTYMFLHDQYEAAKLDVQKDIPIMQILDSPTLPALKSGPRRILSIFFSGVASFMLMVLIITLHDSFTRRVKEKHAESYETLRRDAREAFPRSTRVLRLINKTREKS